MTNASVSLRYVQGSANKIYNAHLIQKDDDGWVVNFAYGRAGKPLRTGTKTVKPVDEMTALDTFKKLVNSKMAKGYTPDANGVPFQGSEKAGETTGWLPQLLNPVERAGLPRAFLHWGSVWAQIKHDGERRGVIITKNDVIPANRKGLRTTVIPKVQEDLEYLAAMLVGDYTLDTEDMGENLVIFDVLTDQCNATFYDRIESLKVIQSWINTNRLDNLTVDMPVLMESQTDIDAFIDAAEAAGEEGVVFRNGDSVYTPGRPNSGGDCVKYKFYASATCVVESVHPTKRSIGLALWKGIARLSVGNCTIPPNYAIPQVGELVEIKYLYAYHGGSIYQPQYKGIRGDLDESAATMDQLKYKKV